MTPEQLDAHKKANAKSQQKRYWYLKNIKLGYLKDKAEKVIENEDNQQSLDIGNLYLTCHTCGALYFDDEHVKSNKEGVFREYCRKGKLEIENPFGNYPVKLYDMMVKNDTTLSKPFHEHIRNYNSAFTFASHKAESHDATTLPYCYRIQGQIYHTVNLAAHPDEGQKPSYAQLYFLDTNEANDLRMEHGANKRCGKKVMDEIDNCLKEVSPYYDIYQTLGQIEEENKKKYKADESPDDFPLSVISQCHFIVSLSLCVVKATRSIC